MIVKTLSGAQTGSDIGGLKAAKACGIATGGTMPKGWITQAGPKPEYQLEYNMVEGDSDRYPPRTRLNVLNSDGTVRFARDFTSAGEKCTLGYISKNNKPYFDIDINNPPSVSSFAKWVADNDIKVLNVAGNSEKTAPGIEMFVFDYLCQYFKGPKVDKSEKTGVKVTFIGERDFNEYSALVKAAKKSKLIIDEVIIGDNNGGVDVLAEQFAIEHRIPVRKIVTDWKNLDAPGSVVKSGQYGDYNSKAGFDKNQKIAQLAECGIAVQRSGFNTDDMLKRFAKMEKTVFTMSGDSKDLYEF